MAASSSMPSTPPTPPTPTKERPGRKKKEAPIGVTQFIHHLPRAEKEALQEFEVLEHNSFQYKSLGRSGQQEDMMICDCVFDPDEDDPDQACGPHSNCINRLTQVECLRNECQTRDHCKNQRFSKRQYAAVEVVQTEKKGYGLRAGDNMVTDEFIYEYIGEVVSQPAFLKRMQAYADEGIQHFYFMMLQREEYLDATKKGGIARFANHSCNPNCYVAKWVVGKRMRMGIFAKRDIERGEELTFNYNVDRYGHTAQICYCDEPNCVGTIGGKTQTDLGGMDDLYIDALGIADDVEALGLKGTKKKKGRKLDEDFVPILKPMGENEVPKVVAAIRQCTNNRGMLCKLLDRVKMTEDEVVTRQLMRMHGFSLMWMVMTETPEDLDILRLVLGIMTNWKLTTRNKIEDAKIEEPVTQCLESPHEDIQQTAQALLTYWSGLQSVYRIPRKILVHDAVDDAPDDQDRETTPPEFRRARHLQSSWDTAPGSDFQLAPLKRPNGFNPYKPKPMFEPTPATPTTSAPVYDKARLEAILALAKVNQEAGAAAAAQLVKVEASDGKKRERHRTRDNKDAQRKKPKLSEEERREKKLSRLVGEVVLKNMSKYRDQMEKETFKQYAKECTHVLVSKEKKHPSYAESQLEALSSEKQEKIKSFVKEYSHKVLKKLKEKGKLRKPDSQQAGPSSPNMSSSLQTEQEQEQDARLRDAEFVNAMFGPDLDDDVVCMLEPR